MIVSCLPFLSTDSVDFTVQFVCVSILKGIIVLRVLRIWYLLFVASQERNLGVGVWLERIEI